MKHETDNIHIHYVACLIYIYIPKRTDCVFTHVYFPPSPAAQSGDSSRWSSRPSEQPWSRCSACFWIPAEQRVDTAATSLGEAHAYKQHAHAHFVCEISHSVSLMFSSPLTAVITIILSNLFLPDMLLFGHHYKISSCNPPLNTLSVKWKPNQITRIHTNQSNCWHLRVVSVLWWTGVSMGKLYAGRHRQVSENTMHCSF